MKLLQDTLISYIRTKFHQGEKVIDKGKSLQIGEIEFCIEDMPEIGTKEGTITYNHPKSGIAVSYFIPRPVFIECYELLIAIGQSQEFSKVIDDIKGLK